MQTSNDSLTLLGIFFVGLGLNLTPCVYPMMSITASLFGKKDEPNRLQAFLKALLFVSGMCAMYSSLGVAAALTGQFFGSILSNRFVLIGISALFLGLALGSFGLYTFTLPAFANKIASRRATGLIGIFLSGLFAGVFAAPCIGPPVVALLTFVGTKGDPVYAFLVFFILSAGLGLPYLIFGTFSGLLGRLPKSGMWLVWVEKLFGVILLGFAMFYALLAVKPDLIKWLVPLVLVGGGIYLGFIDRSPSYSPGFLQIKRIVGVMAVTAGLVFPSVLPKEGVKWESYSPEKIAQAKAEARPVIMDFYADWCIPCHELDRFTYTDPQVIKALDSFVRIKVDMTNTDTPEAEKIIEQYELQGVPTVLFIDKTGAEHKDLRINGFVPPKEILPAIQSVQQEKKA